MELIVKPFEALTPRQLYEILRLRVDVFVVEQQCPYPELDGKDPAALHLFLQDASGIHAYLRLLPPGLAFETASLGRVVSRDRGLGLGDRILRAGIQKARAGFRQIGAEFLEDGIPHVPMRLELASLGASCRKE